MKKLFTLLTFMVVSIATYGYTDVVDPGYNPDGGTFTKDVAVKWSTQGLVASIDVSNCASTGDDQILTIGSKIDTYSASNSEVMHFYFKHNTSGVGGTLEVLYFSGSGDNSKICAKKSVNSDELVIRFNQKDGVIVNGVSFNHKPKNTYSMGDSITSDISSYYSSIFALESTKIGSADGGTKAKYNYIRLFDKTAAFTNEETTSWDYQGAV